MKTLNPEEFLSLLRSLGYGQKLPISDVKVAEDMDGNMFRVDLKLANKDLHFFVPADWTKEIGGLHYMHESNSARLHAESLITGRLGNYYEGIYKDWVLNDTGYKISQAFERLIINEITRLEEEFVL